MKLLLTTLTALLFLCTQALAADAPKPKPNIDRPAKRGVLFANAHCQPLLRDLRFSVNRAASKKQFQLSGI